MEASCITLPQSEESHSSAAKGTLEKTIQKTDALTAASETTNCNEKTDFRLVAESTPGNSDLKLELYNRKQDPQEKEDLAKTHPEIANRLLILMTAHHQAQAQARETNKAAIDEEVRERLEALGYVQ